ncbi:hypothetical protein VTK26DRAFT_9465 [Humicola hyalothermophila]
MVSRRHNPLHIVLFQPHLHLCAARDPPRATQIPRGSHSACHPGPSRTDQRHRPLSLLRPGAPLNPGPPHSQHRPPHPAAPCIPAIAITLWVSLLLPFRS